MAINEKGFIETNRKKRGGEGTVFWIHASGSLLELLPSGIPPSLTQPIIRGLAGGGVKVSIDFGLGPENTEPEKLELSAVAMATLLRIYLGRF